MGDRPMQPGGQLYESDEAIAEDKRKRAVRGSLEALCGMGSIQMACVDFDWMGMERNLLASTYAAEVRKIYAMPDAIASEPATDTDIIDRFIGAINNQFLPGLEERVKETRTDLDQFMKDGLSRELKECGISLKVANATIKLTEKGKLALQRIEDELDPNVEVV